MIITRDHRDIVVTLLQVADPVESTQRKYHRLKHRVYRLKVNYIIAAW